MNKAFFIAGCAALIAGCSGPAPRQTVNQNNVTPESGQAPDAQLSAVQQDWRQAAQTGLAAERKEPHGRKNPFLREGEEKLFESTKDRLLITNLDLSAIFYSPGASTVIIDGQFYTEGDSVDNKKIVTISAEEVILQDAQSVYVLRLQSVLSGQE